MQSKKTNKVVPLTVWNHKTTPMFEQAFKNIDDALWK